MIISIFYDRYSKSNRKLVDHDLGHGRDVLRHIFEAELMTGLCPLLLAKTYRDHFEHAAFNGTPKCCMRLDPVYNNNRIRFRCCNLVAVDRQAIRQPVELHNLHR
ncbi:hypothetical protein D3C78_1583400 [compost metagenome]